MLVVSCNGTPGTQMRKLSLTSAFVLHGTTQVVSIEETADAMLVVSCSNDDGTLDCQWFELSLTKVFYAAQDNLGSVKPRVLPNVGLVA
jgi:hypothetical protein